MPAPYSDDIRQKAVAAVERSERKSHICRMFHISRNTLDLWLQRRAATGSIRSIRDYRRGPQPKINDLEAFRAFAQTHGHLTQQQMAQQWCEPNSDPTIGQAFLGQLQAYVPEQLVYIDEAGTDNTEDYSYGWCETSQRFHAVKMGHRTEGISMIAGWCNRQVLAAMTFKGYCDTAWVEAWVEQYLIPDLRPGQVVIMDNASFHKSAGIRELIEQAGCELPFLPPYSPDLEAVYKVGIKAEIRGTSMSRQLPSHDSVDVEAFNLWADFTNSLLESMTID